MVLTRAGPALSNTTIAVARSASIVCTPLIWIYLTDFGQVKNVLVPSTYRYLGISRVVR